MAALVLVLGVGCAGAVTDGTAAPQPTPTTADSQEAQDTLSSAPSPQATAAPDLVQPGDISSSAELPTPTGTSVTEPATATPSSMTSVLDLVPPVNISVHSVPLEEILFDTFDGRFLRLSEADDDAIRRLRDAIPPIYSPVYGDADALDWLGSDDLVIGYLSGGEAYAYPLKVLTTHELVNDVIDGQPVLISYCPLCASAVVYSRELDGQTLLFGNTSALYESDLVMYDHQTGSYWFQVAGEAIVGSLTGERLKLLPSMTITWGEWQNLHPDTRLLSKSRPEGATFSRRRYDGNSLAGYADALDAGNFAFPVSEEVPDDRLRVSEVVLVVEAGGSATAFPVARLAGQAVNTEVGGEPIVVFSDEGTSSAFAFARTSEGRELTFWVEGGEYFDLETASTWSLAGEAIVGPSKGARLQLLPSRRAFWFSIALALPDVDLYLP